MIHFLTTPRGAGTVRSFLGSDGRHLGSMVGQLAYRDVREAGTARDGVHVFADLERLRPRARQHAIAHWQALRRHGRPTLNDPARTLGRYDLLRRLHRVGLNDFDIHRVGHGERPTRFPVFVRRENDHGGSLTPLLADGDALDRALVRLVRAGVDPSTTVITEFCDTRDASGLVRKYGAFVIGGRIVPRHVLVSRHWMIKDCDLVDASVRSAEDAYVRGNPHEAELRAVADLAAVDYGRIDYGVKDGRIQIWEINTNPVIAASPIRRAPPLPGSAPAAGRAAWHRARALMGPRPRVPVHPLFWTAFESSLRDLDAASRVPPPHGGTMGLDGATKLRPTVASPAALT